MKLTLIRHTSLQIEAGICYGQSDIDVAESFASESASTQAKLTAIKFDAVYSSPLQRCVKLAEALNLGDIAVDTRLMELNFGDWELRAWDDIPRDMFDAWGHDYANKAPPNGETFSQLQQRGIHFLTEMLTKHAGEHIVIISHGGMIRALLAHVLNMELKGLFRFTIDYGSVTQLDFNGTISKVLFVNL
ncbi:MAG: alpha-ribazole phosphatase [Bdellovibrio sp.]|nr:alpha-ribazole phosphatase [Methylotenera sp.]